METVIRVALIYVFILLVLRLLGKRELSQLSPMELVLLILIPELVSQALVREDFSMTNAIIAVTTLASLVFVTSVLAYRFPRFGELIEGKPSMLVTRGKLVNDTMGRERIPPDEIAAEMRKAGIERLDEVKWGILESGGRIAFIAYRDDERHRPREEERLE